MVPSGPGREDGRPCTGIAGTQAVHWETRIRDWAWVLLGQGTSFQHTTVAAEVRKENSPNHATKRYRSCSKSKIT